jgi:hypothetical protein
MTGDALTRGELIDAVRVLREQADLHAAREEFLLKAAESGAISYELSDSQRFDIWESDSDSFHNLLDIVERYLEGEES